MTTLDEINSKISDRFPISVKEAGWLFQNASMQTLSELALKAKSFFHKADEASYLIMAIVNYTNVCIAKCDYCSFYRFPHHKDSYLLTHEQVFEKIDELISYGGTLVGFNGGFHPKLRIEHYADLFEAIHKRYPTMTFYEMTVAEFMFSCKVSKMPYAEGARILKKAGTQWVTGGGAEILDDRFRKRHSPGKFTVEDYYLAQKAILDAGMGSTATMVIGFDESLEERLNHLERLRRFQRQEAGRLASFLCWTYKPWNNELGGKEIETEEYLRWLAVCRIYLDNFKHIRTSVLTKNEEALDALKYGANDFDLPTEDEVTQKAGATISKDFDDILAKGKNLGFKLTHRKPFAINSTSSKKYRHERGLPL